MRVLITKSFNIAPSQRGYVCNAAAISQPARAAPNLSHESHAVYRCRCAAIRLAAVHRHAPSSSTATATRLGKHTAPVHARKMAKSTLSRLDITIIVILIIIKATETHGSRQCSVSPACSSEPCLQHWPGSTQQARLPRRNGAHARARRCVRLAELHCPGPRSQQPSLTHAQ
ncbi:hypothetical protein PLESTF_001568900 [Pleodorina starrii]|nr:hypothetical protein PLESTF_001568900 [Pleodorina starrii]